MKTIVFLLFLCVGTISLHAASKDSISSYSEGQVIVKFKQGSEVELNTQARKKRVSAKLMDIMLQIGATNSKQLMPHTNSTGNNRFRMKVSKGTNNVQKDLSSLYVINFDPNQSVKEVVAMLKELDEVEYAEPNYIVKAVSCIPSSEASTANRSDKKKLNKANHSFNDPLFSDQWGLEAINMPALWEKTIINPKRPIIAILDTGIETNHPDLTANIWQNVDETENETDSDENGFVDDVHGWNFIENSPNVEDDNGHGTHCAGIAAAVGDNQEGISGANQDALVMPVKVLDSEGYGNIEQLIQGLDYAVANNADIISMSLTSMDLSEALEDALCMAYDYAVILAAAGNDNNCMDFQHHSMHGHVESDSYGPHFPAASKYVLGVMATNESGDIASFSNFDCDGPLRAKNPITSVHKNLLTLSEVTF